MQEMAFFIKNGIKYKNLNMKHLTLFSLLFFFFIKFSGLSAQVDTLVGWNFPNNPDDNIADAGIAANLTKTITNTASGTTIYTATGVTTFAASNTNWTTGTGTKYWEVEFSTQGYNNVTVQSKQRSSNTGPRDFKVQYKVGLAGTWTDIAGATILDSNDWVHGILLPTLLPSETFDQASVYVRWIMTSDIAANGTVVATAGTSRIDDIYLKGSLISADAEILTFDIPAQISSTVNSLAGTVDIVMPYGTNVTALTPSITISAGATISPVSGVSQDFTNPVPYIVTASDGITTKNWTVTVTVQPASTEAEIISFNIPAQLSGNINSLAATVDIVMPLGTNLTALIPAITVSTGASISPVSGVAQDFTNPVLYTVTAQDGITTKTWTVTVTIQANNQAEILTFDIPSQVSSTIDGLGATVDIVMPFGTNVTNLTPSITLSQGATVSPVSGIVQNFTSPVNYVVTAEDGVTTKNWTVNVSVQPGSSAAEIITFDIPGQTSSIVNSLSSTVDILMPSGTDVTNLTPAITISANATILPNTGIGQDFTLPVTYVVTAEDGATTKSWTVTVTVAQTTIVEWNFPNNPDDNIADGGIAANLSKTVTTTATGTLTYTFAGASTSSISSTGWDAGMDSKYWEIEFTTAGYKDITLASKQRSSSTGPKDWKIQYKIGNSGLWADVPGANVTDSNDWVHGVYPETMLPSGTFNKPSVYIRWIMTSDVAVNLSAVGSAGTSKMDDIIVKGLPAGINNEAEIYAFDISGQVSSVINSTSSAVTVTMPFGTDVTNLVPAIVTSVNATIFPNSGVSQDYTLPVVYTVTAEDGITTKDWTVTVDVLTSAEIINDEIDFVLYPNPASEEVYFNFKEKLISDLKIELISVDGKVLLNEKPQNNSILLNGISPGVYFVKIIKSDSEMIQKLIVK